MRFRLFGTEIYVSFLFCAVIAFMLATDRTGLCIPTIFAIFIHETGHLFAMWVCECQPKSIMLVPASVKITRAFPKVKNGEIIIALSGPLSNIVIFLSLYINFCLTKSDMSLVYASVNLIIALFNLLPVSGLDGGDVLTALINKISKTNKGEGVIKIISVLLGAVFFFLGVFLYLRGSLNISVFIIALYLVVCSLLRQ